MAIEVTIRGKVFPLCLTVAALDALEEKCEGLSGLGRFLSGDPSEIALLEEDQLEKAGVTKEMWEREKNEAFNRSLYPNAWVLGLLIQEGEENRLMEAMFDGGDTNRRKVPGPEEMVHLLTPGQVTLYRSAVAAAVHASMKRTLEAVPSKNGYQAGER